MSLIDSISIGEGLYSKSRKERFYVRYSMDYAGFCIYERGETSDKKISEAFDEEKDAITVMDSIKRKAVQNER